LNVRLYDHVAKSSHKNSNGQCPGSEHRQLATIVPLVVQCDPDYLGPSTLLSDGVASVGRTTSRRWEPTSSGL